MKKFSIAGAFIAGISTCIIILFLCGFNEEEHKIKQAISYGSPNVLKFPSIPEHMSFAGEDVPLDRWEVRESFERELLFNYYMPANIFYMLKLSKRHFPQIEAQLKANGIPDDFKYLCVAESNLQNAISKVGATGFWQFMKGTAPAYDLEVSSTVDERYHVERSTKAACSYLKRAYERFGNWTAAAASYNCGIGGYGERSSFQGSDNYYDLALPEETQRYIFRILAFKQLLSNADSLGFVLPASASYSPLKTRTVIIDRNIPNLATFARENGTSYKILKMMNPWMRERSLNVKSGKNYAILLPAE
jgi:membrane-bound lytic murein transglycosylase D